MDVTIYDAEKVLMFFEDYNLGPWKLGTMLDIPGSVVKKYLLENARIDEVWAKKINIAIDIIRSKWLIGEVNHKKNGEEEMLKKLVAEAMKAAKKEEEERKRNAVNIIVMILMEDDPGEFMCGEDPISNRGGLERYSKEEFIRQIKKRVSEY